MSGGTEEKIKNLSEKPVPGQRIPFGMYITRRKRVILLPTKLFFAHPANKLPEFYGPHSEQNDSGHI
jgi:hypothetical protein